MEYKKHGPAAIFQTPSDMLKSFKEWRSIALNTFIEVQVPVLNKTTGEPLTLRKPKPITIEYFCEYVGMTWEAFSKYRIKRSFKVWENGAYKEILYQDLDENGLSFADVTKTIEHFVITQLIERQQLGIITDNSAKFYAVNNSRYQDVSHVQHSESDKPKPAWLTSPDKPKTIGGESIDFKTIDKPEEE